MPPINRKYDWRLIALYIGLVLFGWVNIYAATFNEAQAAVFDFSSQHGKQLIWIGLAAITAFAVLMTDPRVFSTTAYIIYMAVIALLVATLFIATVTKGARSWIDIGPFKLQPSEFAKFATALAVAYSMGQIDFDIRQKRSWIVLAGLIGIPACLTLLQHDTGSALVFAGFLFPLFREGLSPYIPIAGFVAAALFVLALLINKYLLIGIVVLCCIAWLYLWLSKRTRKDYIKAIVALALCTVFTFSVDFAFNNILEPHQRERIEVLLGKSDDLKGAGYNVHQSKIAIGSGGLFGKGFLHGTITKADFVPEQETDFIFCTVGEEWGFWGSAMVIGAYLLLLIRIITVAERQHSIFSRVYGYCVAGILFMHFFINLGMVIGLLPVIGIPLPFFSYGGSSLLAFTILLFVFIRQDASRTQGL